VVGLPLAQTVHEFSRINEWKDLHSGIRGLIRGWLTAKPQIPLEPERFNQGEQIDAVEALFAVGDTVDRVTRRFSEILQT
jgi:hypothetical protein